MIAAFLKTADGDFDSGALYASVFFVAIISLEVWILYGALKKGRIPFGYAGKMGSVIWYIERQKNPLGYWCVFSLFCGVIALFVFAIYARCSELW
jgi:hypothetical protein